MTRIDSIRLAQIFRSLASKGNRSQSKSHTASKTLSKDQLAAAVRDEGELKARLQKRLQTLEKKSEDFSQDAPYAAIEEIMSWEFGDQFINHPEFKHIVTSIVTNIKDSPELSTHMNAMVNDLIHR